MDLSSLLSSLPSDSPGGPRHGPPITEVLARLQERLIGAAQSPSHHDDAVSAIGLVEQLFRTGDPHWLFSLRSTNQVQGESLLEEEQQRAYVGLVRAVTSCAALPLCETDSGSLPAGCYQPVPRRALEACNALTALLEALGGWRRLAMEETAVETGEGEGTKCDPGTSTPPQAPVRLLHALAPLCCVFAVTHFQEQPWSSPASREAASGLMGALLRAGRWRDAPHLLVGERESGGILGGILDVLQPELTKERWQRCEAVKLVFSWTLLQVKRPSLSSVMDRMLSPSLLLSDDHRLENRLLGVRCLHHIVLNVPRAELRQFNRAEVVYQALFNHLYTTDTPVVEAVLLCLLDVLVVLEDPPCSPPPSSRPRKPGRHDDVLRLMLTHMEMESRMDLRHVYASMLPLFIERMGIAVCRHLKRVEQVVVGYLEVEDPPEEQARLGVLQALEKTIQIAWPRMGGQRVFVLLRSLLRLLVDVTSDSLLSPPIQDQLTSQIVACLTLLDRCTGGGVQSALQGVDSSCSSAAVRSCLAKVSVATQK